MAFFVRGMMESTAFRSIHTQANNRLSNAAGSRVSGWLSSMMQYINPNRQPPRMPRVRFVSHEEQQRMANENFQKRIEEILSKKQ